MAARSWAERTMDGTSGDQSISNNTQTVVTYYNNSSGGTKDFLTGAPSNGFIVPAGVELVRFHISLRWNSTNPGYKRYAIRHDPAGTPANIWTHNPQKVNQLEIFNWSTPWFKVSENDAFDFTVYHIAGVSLTLLNTSDPANQRFKIIDATGEIDHTNLTAL